MKLLKSYRISSIAFLMFLILTTGCSKDKDENEVVKESSSVNDIVLKFTSHNAGNVVSRPLPLKMTGKIENYSDLDDEVKKNGLNIYLIEQSTKERIWHIEPRGKVDNDGNWKAITWLGNYRQGNRNTFNVCVFASKNRLKLRNGNHPVKVKPDNIGEECIKLVRKDK